MKLIFVGGPKDGHVTEYCGNVKTLPRWITVRTTMVAMGQVVCAWYGLGARRRDAKTIRARFIGWKLGKAVSQEA